MIPDDKRPSAETSGIRIGTPAVTTRGMNEKEMIIIADLIDEVLKNTKNKSKILESKRKAIELTKKFPLPY